MIVVFWLYNAKLSFLPSYGPATTTGMKLSGQRGERQKEGIVFVSSKAYGHSLQC